ncbi:hypothetical protein, partial [Nocardia farcinica]|uniref:hypothetical protein n=1 Tax=Nocardia farcinica TaxID=37329 RepID=UPI002454B916
MLEACSRTAAAPDSRPAPTPGGGGGAPRHRGETGAQPLGELPLVRDQRFGVDRAQRIAGRGDRG